MAFRGKLPKIVVSAAPDDTTRIKRDMAATVNRAQWGVPNAQQQLDKYAAQADTLKQLRKGNDTYSQKKRRAGAPTGTHKSFAEGVDAFDGAACTSESAPKPPTASIPRGTTPAVSLPSAVGRPAGVQLHDGTDNARSNGAVYDAADSRPESSSGRGPSAPQHFNDSSV